MVQKKSADYKTRGQEFIGKVISSKMTKTVTVEWESRKYIKKYERYAKRRTRVHAHNPDNIGANEGDIVKIKQTRPLSKTKHYTVIGKIEPKPVNEPKTKNTKPNTK